MPSLANRITRIPPSATIAITNKANELKQQGVDIVGLAAGEPDFDTPDFIKQAAIDAIKSGDTKYTAVEGTKELRTAIVNKFKRENNLDYNINQILVSCGAKQSIYNLATILLESGDEALIPTPYWVSYTSIVELTDATPVIINTEKADNFKLTPNLLEQSLTSKTKLLILNSPSNPSGKIYNQQEFIALAKILLKHPNVYIISDDIYEHIIWPGNKFHNILSACKDALSPTDYDNLYQRTIVINGVSKAYAMTGWRIGYAAGSVNIINAMKKLQSQSTSNPCSIAQAAAACALSSPKTAESIKQMVEQFKLRHDYIYTAINQLELFSVLPADGAFYSFIDCNAIIKHKNLKNDIELVEQLLLKAGLAFVDGSSFGCPNYIRLSYATSMDNLKETVKRLERYIKE